MTKPPSRAEILAALQDPDPNNPLAIRVADALGAFSRSLSDAAEQRGGFERVALPAPIDEVQGVALELFVEQLRQQLPGTKITIKGDS